MKSALLIMKSVTEANKARYHLERFKIKSIVEKITVKNGGCSYGVRIHDDPEKVCRLLSVVNIYCQEIHSEINRYDRSERYDKNEYFDESEYFAGNERRVKNKRRI